MPQETILETEYATLWYYPEDKIVRHVFHKYIYGDRLRQVLETGLQTFRQRGGTKWLSDDRNNSALPDEDLKWSLEVWAPLMLESGWRYWAMVLPNKLVGQANMKRILGMYEGLGLTVQVFEDPEEALAWLQSV